MTKFRIGSIIILCCALFCAASTITAFAVDYYWNVASGDWSDGTNWDPAGPPTGSAWAIIDNGGTANIDTDITFDQIRVYDGTVNQNSYNVAMRYMSLGTGGTDGVYNMSDGYLNVERQMRIGSEDSSSVGGQGYFNMSGGIFDVGEIYIDYKVGGYGELNVSGGILNIFKELYVGYGDMRNTNIEDGNGIANQTGGVINLQGNLYISKHDTGAFTQNNGYGIYNMEGGVLYLTGINGSDETPEGNIYVGSEDGHNAGVMNLKGGEIAVSNFYITDHGYVNDAGSIPGAGAILGVWNDFRNYTEARKEFDLRHTTVILHGGTGLDAGTQEWDFSILDMNCWDVGASVDGLDINFAIGNLVFSGQPGSSQWYRLESDIYCYGLSIEAGALVDLNGYNIYYMPQGCGAYSAIQAGTFQLNGMWGNMNAFDHGDVIAITDAPAVPEPGTIVLIGTGVLALAGLVRKIFHDLPVNGSDQRERLLQITGFSVFGSRPCLAQTHRVGNIPT